MGQQYLGCDCWWNPQERTETGRSSSSSHSCATDKNFVAIVQPNGFCQLAVQRSWAGAAGTAPVSSPAALLLQVIPACSPSCSPLETNHFSSKAIYVAPVSFSSGMACWLWIASWISVHPIATKWTDRYFCISLQLFTLPCQFRAAQGNNLF